MPPISVNDLIKFQIKMKFQLGRISLLLWEKGIQYGSIVFYWQKKHYYCQGLHKSIQSSPTLVIVSKQQSFPNSYTSEYWILMSLVLKTKARVMAIQKQAVAHNFKWKG